MVGVDLVRTMLKFQRSKNPKSIFWFGNVEYDPNDDKLVESFKAEVAMNKEGKRTFLTNALKEAVPKSALRLKNMNDLGKCKAQSRNLVENFPQEE